MKGIIIGGGIAGLSAAIALKKAGVDYEIFESAEELKPVGAGISLSINAMRVYRSFGLDDKITALGSVAQKMIGIDHRGRPISQTDPKKYLEQYGVGFVFIHRSRLQEALLSAIDLARLKTGHRLRSVEEKGGRVIATFTNGHTAEGDFLLGADGIHSVIRQQLFPEAKLRYSGQTCWRGVTRFDLGEGANTTQFEAWGGKLRFGCTPIGFGEVYYFAVKTAPAGGKDAHSGLPDRLADEFAHFLSPVERLIRSTRPEDIIRGDLHDLAPMPRWHKGRILLIGDAAHATTPNMGQGGCQAAEDAYYLGRLLAQGKSIPQVFEDFEAIRRPKVNWIVETSMRFGKIAHWTWGKGLRNWILRQTPASVIEKQLHRVFHIEE